MKRRPLMLSTFLAVLLSTSNSSAEPTVQDWLKDKNKWIQYVDGLGTGLRLANIHIRATGQKPIFCPPEKLPIGASINMDIIDREIREDSRVKTDTFIGIVLLLGYVDTFPCSGTK